MERELRPLTQPKGTFATYIRGLTSRAVPVSFPFFVLEGLPQTTKDDRDAVRQHSRARYAQPWQQKADHGDTSEDQAAELPEENDDDDPLKPSPEL